MTRVELYDLCHGIIKAQRALNTSVDKLLEASGVTTQGVDNGDILQETDTE